MSEVTKNLLSENTIDVSLNKKDIIDLMIGEYEAKTLSQIDVLKAKVYNHQQLYADLQEKVDIIIKSNSHFQKEVSLNTSGVIATSKTIMLQNIEKLENSKRGYLVSSYKYSFHYQTLETRKKTTTSKMQLVKKIVDKDGFEGVLYKYVPLEDFKPQLEKAKKLIKAYNTKVEKDLLALNALQAELIGNTTTAKAKNELVKAILAEKKIKLPSLK